MERYLCGVLICLLGLGFMRSEAFEVTVKDDSNTVCIYANLKVNFTIQYETNRSTLRNVTLSAPDEVTTTGSTCGGSGEAPLLVVNFGDKHSWSLNFSSNSTVYNIDVIVFTYNTNDSLLFPDGKRKGLLSTVKTVDKPIPLNSTYMCTSKEVVLTENVVQIYWDVSLLAYAHNLTVKKEFHCSADSPPTSAPTTPGTTTANATTANTTSTAPTPTPKPADKPAIGNYNVTIGNETCVLASMGLQLNASLLVDGHNAWTQVNINPNTTDSSGSCSNVSAFLRLNDSGTTFVDFYFFVKEKNFILKEVNVTFANASGTSQRANLNLSLWEASVGNSYLCHKEQLISVSEDLSINAFEVRVQPFNVTSGKYAIASECSLDDDSILIPIIVGAALAGLIVIIVIAYLIGRRKTYAGYQTL